MPELVYTGTVHVFGFATFLHVVDLLWCAQCQSRPAPIVGDLKGGACQLREPAQYSGTLSLFSNFGGFSSQLDDGKW